jgi:hypothetical protein
MNFVTIFASIGLVFVILYVVWFVMKKMKNSNQNMTTNNLPVNYMKNVGLRCPDYYINTNNENNQNTCKNSYNLEQNIDENTGMSNNTNCSDIVCYHDVNDKSVNFEEIKNWGSMNDDQRVEALKLDGKNSDGTYKTNSDDSKQANRCDWIKCCGSSVGSSSSYQPWLEIKDYCDRVSAIN